MMAVMMRRMMRTMVAMRTITNITVDKMEAANFIKDEVMLLKLKP